MKLIYVLAACSLAMSLGLLAQDPPVEPAAPAPEKIGAPGPEILTERLRLELRPMAKAELETAMDAWMGALRGKIKEVGDLEIQLLEIKADDARTDEGGELEKRLIDLKIEENAMIERARLVADELRAKGGDVEEVDKYLAAVSAPDSTASATSRFTDFVAGVKSWMASPDGGKMLGKRIFVAILIFLVFWMLSKYIGRLIGKALRKRKQVSNLLLNFAVRTSGAVVLIVGVLMALSAFGLEIGPMMAALGAGGFIVGFALQETLGSLASGLMIMIYRPFDVDDYVSLAGVEGKVKEMSLVSTSLLTVDNKVVMIPNQSAWGGTITNFSSENLRRVDLVFGIGYDDEIPKAMALLAEIAAAHELVIDDPKTDIEIVELADSSVNLCCRPWVNTPDYWRVFWDLTREVKLRFDAEGISIPYPQRDVHLQTAPPAGESVA